MNSAPNTRANHPVRNLQSNASQFSHEHTVNKNQQTGATHQPGASESDDTRRHESGQRPVLELINITRTHQDGPNLVKTLDSVSLTVYPGELIAVMGPSGADKSSLLHIAGVLDTPTSGKVIIEGNDTSQLSHEELAALRRQRVGFVFQNYNLIDTLTVGENVALPLELDGIARSKALGAAKSRLADLGLGDLVERFPSEISGGQRQRVAIARGLVGSRSLILADEPTGALDTTTGETVMAAIRQTVDAGAAAIVVTHEMRFAAYAHRVLFLRDGKLHANQNQALLKRRPGKQIPPANASIATAGVNPTSTRTATPNTVVNNANEGGGQTSQVVPPQAPERIQPPVAPPTQTPPGPSGGPNNWRSGYGTGVDGGNNKQSHRGDVS